MSLLLVRHSDAVSAGGEVGDGARWLSQTGRDKARRVGEALREVLAAEGCSFAHFVASPRVRAMQTAELVAQALGFGGPIVSLPSLSFTEPAARAAQDLMGLSGTVAAFGHMPTLTEIASLLCSDASAPSGLAPCEALWIDGGRARWTLDPHSFTRRSGR